MRFSTFLRLGAMLGATVFLSACGGKGDKCKTAADCGTNQTCNTDTGACTDIVDPCLARTTPCNGDMTCDPATGECTGTCCSASSCPDPRTTCKETKCAAGEGSAACEQKVCTEDATTANGCKADFNCNPVNSPPTCEAACLTDGCAEANEHCNPTTGACDLRLPMAGEVGSACAANSECNVADGLVCFDEATYGIKNGLCTKQCSADTECPSGSFCGQGVCLDACDNRVGDCPVDQQCITVDGTANDYCWSIFDQSACTTGCLATGAPCDPNTPDQCAEGAACVDFSGGNAMCMPLSCHLGLDPFTGAPIACKAGESCQGLGIGLTGCMVGCDPTDASACGSLSNANGSSTCGPSAQIASNFDGFFITDDLKKCIGTELDTGVTGQVGGQDLFLCTHGCTADTDCGVGQFCDDAELAFTTGDVVTFKTCMNYNVKDSVTCADAPCGTHDCVDLDFGAAGTAVVCHDACTADADCTAATVGASCNRLTFGSGDSMDLCLYDTAGAFCFFGCDGNGDCGYCVSDADCPEQNISSGVTRQERCDLATNNCVMPLNGVAEVNDYCSSGQVYWAGSINVLDATGSPTTVGGCGSPCDSDLECGGARACVPNSAATPNTGFCERGVALCNGPTAQCEDVCGVAGDCLHGSCATADGPLGENRCVASCTADGDCGPGVCDTGLGYCTAMQMWNLDVDASGSTAADDVKVFASVRDSAGKELATGSTLMFGGGFAAPLGWSDLLPDGGDYTVDIYLDLDGDSACTDATTDDVYQVVITAVSADVSQNLDLSTATEVPAACGSF